MCGGPSAHYNHEVKAPSRAFTSRHVALHARDIDIPSSTPAFHKALVAEECVPEVGCGWLAAHRWSGGRCPCRVIVGAMDRRPVAFGGVTSTPGEIEASDRGRPFLARWRE
jgi:hypothetical protein